MGTPSDLFAQLALVDHKVTCRFNLELMEESARLNLELRLELPSTFRPGTLIRRDTCRVALGCEPRKSN